MFTGTNIFKDAEMLNPNPKNSRSVDPSFLTNCYFMFSNFTTIFFIVKRHAWMKTHGCITQMTNPCESVSTFNKRPFCSNHFRLCNLMRAGRKQHILSTTLRRHKIMLSKILISSIISTKSKGRYNTKSFSYVWPEN